MQNPLAADAFGFCATKILVNGIEPYENGNGFEIDLYQFPLKKGDSVTIMIFHKKGCKPKILNPEVLLPESTFECVSIEADSSGTVKWKTINEKGSLPFVIQQYKWNKWVNVAEVKGIGTPGENDYTFKIIPLSGENKIRIKQLGCSSVPLFTPEVTFTSKVRPVKLVSLRLLKNKLSFSAKTHFEVYDSYGNIVKKGFSNSVDCSTLPRGKYFLNFDNATTQFEKL
ncbi:MAG: hypothetical protein IAF38_06585 [Bacteroidia bacterium]|nr:hypothetical protein [Bacteroidia bacterium]